MQREIPLTRRRRRNLDIGRLFRSQPVAQRVEDLALREAAGARRHIRREILRTRDEGANVELLDGVAHTVQPTRGGWVRSATVTIAAGVADNQKTAVGDLVLTRLIKLHLASRSAGGERGGSW